MANEELIMHAREFTESPNLGKSMARELDKALIYIRELADALEAAEARAKGFEANFPCDGACNYGSGPEENCSLHGRNPADLWGIIANTSAELYEAEARIAELEAGEISALREARAETWDEAISAVFAWWSAPPEQRPAGIVNPYGIGLPVESEGE